MSTKAALILGDYSNGWSDAVAVQILTKFDNIKILSNDRDFVTATLSKHLNMAVAELEGNDKINPRPKDEVCCASFENWAKDLDKNSECICCPFCATKITDERRRKFIGKGY